MRLKKQIMSNHINIKNITYYTVFCFLTSLMLSYIDYGLKIDGNIRILGIFEIVILPILASFLFKRWYIIILPGMLLTWLLAFFWAVVIWKDGI